MPALTRRLSLSVLALTSTIASPAFAQMDSGQNDEAEQVLRGEEGRPIIVIGESELESDELRDALRDVAMRGRHHLRPLERYQSPLCVTVVGMGEQMGSHVAARIRANAAEAGAQVASEDCVTNALVIVVDDQARLIARLRKIQPRLFNARISRQIRAALRRNDAAIAWSSYALRGPGGISAASPVAETTGTDVLGNVAGANVRSTRTVRASAFLIDYSIDKVNTIMVFDVDRLDGVHLDQLADYATMRILGQPQPTVEIAEERASSILSLFDSEPAAAPRVMTGLDRAYLGGLYAMRPNDSSSRLEHFVRVAYEAEQAKD